MSEAYEAAMHTLRTCRRRAIHPEQAGCWTDRDQRLFVRGVLDGLLGCLSRLPLDSRERERVFDALYETDQLVGWLMEIAEVLAGRREPRWIGRGPRGVRRWQRTFEAGHTRKATDITRGVKQ